MPHQNHLLPAQNIARYARLFLTAIPALFAWANLEAATITWGTPQTISTAATDVETDGILVLAIDASSSGDGTSSVTVTGKNGVDVEFHSYDAVNAAEHALFNSKFRNSASFGGGSSDYGGVVDDGFFHGTEAVDGNTEDFKTDTVLLTGLTIGEEYVIQYWAQDAGRNPTYSTDIDVSTSLILDTDDVTYPNSGQFVVGTFTADAINQSFGVSGAINGDNNYGRAQLNAIQLRHLAEPFIEWQPSEDMYPGSTTETFVNNWSETSVLAYNATSTDGVTANPTITLNNVTFTSIDSSTLNSGYTDAVSGVSIQATASPEHATAFQDGAFSSNGDIYNVIASGHWALGTFTISGLNPGTNYQIQVFTNDARRDSNYRVGFSDGSQSHADSILAGTAGLSDLNNDDVADESGDSIVGTFIATSGIQTFSIRGTNNAGVSWNNGSEAQINALQIAVVEEPGDPLTITVGNTPQQQMRYGIDYERLWYWTGSNATKDLVAEWSVADADVDFVRVAMNAKYELDEGVFDLNAYTGDNNYPSNDRIIPMMQDMKDANPDVKFFASPRPLNESHNSIPVGKDDIPWQPYPIWVTGAPSYTSSSYNFNDIKCAEYIVKYLLLMKSYGFKISYIDVTNEWQSNVGGGRLTQDDMDDIHNYLHVTYMAAPWEHPSYSGITLVPSDIPEIVAPSSWNYSQGAQWVNNLDTGDKEAISIVASHNTDRTGTAQDVVDAVTGKFDQPGDTIPEVWNTELHGWKSTSNADEVLTFAYMQECINAGFSGLSGWLARGTSSQGHSYFDGATPTVKYYMFEKLTNTSNRGYALDVNEPDEFKVYWDPDPDQADADSAVSALIRGNLMTVWVLNHSITDYPLTINTTGRTISDHSIKVTRWSQYDGLPDEGETSTISAATATSVVTLAQDNSAYCFEILLEPETDSYTRIEAESYNSSNPASHSTETTTDIGAGLNLSDINDGDWTAYDNINLSEATNIRFRIAAPTGRPDGEIEIRTGSQTGPVIGRTAIPVTGDWQTWCTIETPLDATSGIHDLYLVYTEAGSNQVASTTMFNLNWFELVLSDEVPDAPTNLTATANGSTQIDLSWDTVSEATSYRVLRATSAGGTYTEIASGLSTNSTSDATASIGVPYYYVVRALNGALESPDSNVATETLPLVAPTNLTAAANGSTQIDLDWNAVSGATSYRVLRATSAGGTYSQIASGLTTTSTSDATASIAVPYYYVVRAISGAIESTDSNVATEILPPEAPTNLTATENGNTQIDLDWNAASGATSYRVLRATSSGGPYTEIENGLTTTSTSDDTASIAVPYYYVVRAINGAIESANSNEADATLPLEQPTGLTGISISSSQIDLSWNPLAGATSYTVERSSVRDRGPFDVIASGLVSPSHNDTGLTTGTTYYYRVTGLNGAVSSPVSTVISVVAENPIVVEDIVIDSTSVDLTNNNFSFSLHNSVIGHNYQAQEREDLTIGDWINVGAVKPGTGGILNFVIPTLETDTEYYYRVNISQQ